MSTLAGRAVPLLAVGLVVGLVIGGAAGYLILGPPPGATNPPAPSATTTVTSTVTASASPQVSTTSAPQAPAVPTLPATAPVSLDPKTTAVLVLDYVFCYRMTGCNATLPAIQTLLTSARSAGVPIIYTKAPVPKEIANQTGDTVITNDIGPEKFLNTSLASILQSKGIKTVVVMGIAANGALLYTAQEACVRHYTVVVPLDTVIGSIFVQAYVPYQLLSGPGCSNANNTPLSPSHATLSSTSGISFKTG